MHNKYGLRVIVSEIASIDRNGQNVARFTAEMANWMDGQDWIVEYGFFGCMRQVADNFVTPGRTADGQRRQVYATDEEAGGGAAVEIKTRRGLVLIGPGRLFWQWR